MSNPELKYLAWKDVEREQLNPHIDREMVVGDKIMLARVLMKKGAHVPLHHHHNEQVTYILEGALKFNVGGQGNRSARRRSAVHSAKYASRSVGPGRHRRSGCFQSAA